ncbi:adenylate kinase family enzyme [Sinorhizobium medicae]
MATYLSNIGETSRILSRARRVLVIGCSGSGKTTLARWLSARYDLPFVSMDQAFFWLPGWISRPREEQRALIAEKQ